MNRIARAIYQATFSAQDRIEIYDDFRQYLLDGRSAKETYQKLIDNYSRRGKNPGDAVAQILTECSENLSGGFGLGDSLREWIPDQELSIIESCDLAGSPEDGFQNAISIAQGTGRLSRAVKSTLGVTTYLTLLSVGVIVLFCMMLVPVILQAVPLSQWNSLQTAVYYFYLLLRDWWWALLIVFGGVITLVVLSLPRLTGRLRFFLDRFPPWSIYQRIHGAAFIMNVNAMDAAGIPMERAIASMKESTRSAWLYERLDALERAISAGEENLGQALDATGYEFPGERAIIKLQSLFETKNSEGSLKRFADTWLENTVSSVEQTGDRMRIASLLLCGVLVASLMLIMFGLIQKAFFFN
ncbi:Type II secretory pathway, component PulF [Kosakonia radicincitans]|uniref:Type II secretory pathway, component PulF n=1 Tax=Kosakonia radicincitans TaxID=283686 RepID=A0AAX2EZ59_9ENTR|nr:type II secretion system F family protein [Kosakonia radicincitans]SFF37796.1 Type II secretory pathway, component PulF [Kosakonia radicincitans]SFR26187.1 Type II secretory pathway, component PulF [Kosakonia radicincitans]SFU16675.1 Type II secretory pathway, component PulF [Kosakonia radicincitans]SFY31870.1 Type II secretory pathway, component PulF [Kosakonia radicincitans]